LNILDTNIPTLKQRTACKKIVENAIQGNPKSAGQILRESGYGKIALQPSRILDSKGFQQLLAQVDDKVIVGKVYDILQDDDKRSSLAAADMLLKLKDRYPAGKMKLGTFNERDAVLE